MNNENNEFKFAKISRDIIGREFQYQDDFKSSAIIKFLELNNKEDRECLRDNINGLIEIFDAALKELDLADKEDKEVFDG